MLSFMDAAINTSPRRDTTTPLARYQRATSGDAAYWLTAVGWLDLAAALEVEAFAFEPATESSRKRMDRAADCRSRAARLTRGAL